MFLDEYYFGKAKEVLEVFFDSITSAIALFSLVLIFTGHPLAAIYTILFCIFQRMTPKL